jgi:phage shock protein PspC (stress-responsive transcriptional regulator)
MLYRSTTTLDKKGVSVVIEVARRQKYFVRSIDGYLAGVCEGVAKRLGMDPWLVRTLWIISLLLMGSGAILYFLMAIILPREDQLNEYDQSKILGVCHRISMRTGFDLGMIRLLAILSGIASAGVTVIVYLVLIEMR